MITPIGQTREGEAPAKPCPGGFLSKLGRARLLPSRVPGSLLSKRLGRSLALPVGLAVPKVRYFGGAEQRDHLRAWHDDAGDGAVPLLQLGEVEPQETVQARIGFSRQVSTGQVDHVFIIVALAVRVKLIAAAVPAQIAVKRWADVIKLVEQRDELVVEILIEIARQAKRQQVKVLMVPQKVTLDVERHAAPLSGQLPLGKAQRRDAPCKPCVWPPRAWVTDIKILGTCRC